MSPIYENDTELQIITEREKLKNTFQFYEKKYLKVIRSFSFILCMETKTKLCMETRITKTKKRF